jgi:hypothetical protein
MISPLCRPLPGTNLLLAIKGPYHKTDVPENQLGPSNMRVQLIIRELFCRRCKLSHPLQPNSEKLVPYILACMVIDLQKPSAKSESGTNLGMYNVD